LLYTGYITPERGLDTVVEGVSFAKDNFKNIVLIIIGNGIEVINLKKIAVDLSISSYIEFIEWPGHDRLSTFYKIADICISPQPQCEFWDTTIPHKLFEYMSQSTPILAADSRVIKRIISETNSGMIYKSGDPKDFADKVQNILSSDISFGENGLEAVKEKYNWKKDSQVLIKIYQNMESE
jgi:glycosyltransferase involved in cell wall biosynthesis